MKGLPLLAATGGGVLLLFMLAPLRATGTLRPGDDQNPIDADHGGRAALTPTFEVASVRPNRSGNDSESVSTPAGGFRATNVPLRMLIRQAYRLQDFEIVGGPGWINTDRFDIDARGAAPAVSAFSGPPAAGPSPVQLMLRALLVNRFQLAFHNETRRLRAYRLVLARADGRLGPQLRSTTLACPAPGAGRGSTPAPAAAPSPGSLTCGTRMRAGSMTGGSVTLAQLADNFSRVLGTVVTDDSGLAGRFDFTLEWTPDALSPSGSVTPAAASDGASVFTAVQEQLGLKLEGVTRPHSVMVIDAVERPTDN